MSGRITAYRVGYGDVSGYPDGYGCLGIEQIHIECMDCSSNTYKTIPNECEEDINCVKWTDYGSVASIPDTYTHLCQDKLETGYLNVEYPDVPPVSKRGIMLRPSAAKPTDTCSICWEYEIGMDPLGEKKAYYYDSSNTKIYPQDYEGNEMTEPALPKTFSKDELSATYYDYSQLCSDLYPNEDDDEKEFTVTFEHCPCTDKWSTRKVVTDVFIRDSKLQYRFEEWLFYGNRLIKVNDFDVCEFDTYGEDGPEWETEIIGLSDCPEE